MRPQSDSGDLIYGRRPVQEALEAGRVIKVFFSGAARGGGTGELVQLAKTKKIPFHWVERFQIDRMVQGHHQGVVAQIAPVRFHNLEDCLDRALEKKRTGPVALILDGIQDPQNVGSILRSAYFFDVPVVVIPKWRASSVTGSVVRASAGAAQFIPVSQVSNIGNAIEAAKKRGIWIVGADMTGQDVKKADVPRPFALVLGSEGEGLHALVKNRCDLLVKLTRHATGPAVDSLNVGAAASALLHVLS